MSIIELSTDSCIISSLVLASQACFFLRDNNKGLLFFTFPSASILLNQRSRFQKKKKTRNVCSAPQLKKPKAERHPIPSFCTWLHFFYLKQPATTTNGTSSTWIIMLSCINKHAYCFKSVERRKIKKDKYNITNLCAHRTKKEDGDMTVLVCDANRPSLRI